MELIKSVGVKNLKNNLSGYLRDVKRGWRILVTEREQVIAELHEPTLQSPLVSSNPLLAEWIREGKIRPPLHPKRKLPRSPCRFPSGTALRLLEEDRGK